MRRALWSLLLTAVVGTTLAACASRPHPVIRAANDIPFTASGYDRPEGNDYLPALTDLEKKLNALDITIETVPEQGMGSAEGWADPQQRHIWIPKGISVNTRFEVLAHEAGHIYQPRVISKMGAELFAELVFWELARHYGIDATPRVARYLAGYKESLVFEPAFRADVKRAVDIILKGKQAWD